MLATSSAFKHRAMYASFSVQAFAAADPAERSRGRLFEQSIKSCLVQLLAGRLNLWDHLPFKLVGCLGHSLGVATLDVTRACARECVAEYEEALVAGKAGKVHRVAHFILGRGSGHRAQLEAFAAGQGELTAFPALYIELRAYALVPIVCRRIESAHSEFKGVTKKLTSARFAWMAAAMRRGDVIKELDGGPAFLQFLCNSWRQRDVLRKSLRCVFSHDVKILRELSVSGLYGLWYQSNTETQFRSLLEQERRLVPFNCFVKPCLKPFADKLSTAMDILCRFLKSKFDMLKGYIWSMPQIWLEQVFCTHIAITSSRLSRHLNT
jgi:hypothetical protein